MSDNAKNDPIYAALTARHDALTSAEIAVATGEQVLGLDAALKALVTDGRAFALSDGTFLSDLAAARLQTTAHRVIAAFHKKYPLKRALPRDELRVPLSKAAEYRDFEAVIALLVASDVLVEESPDGVRLPEHRVVMPAAWRDAANEILSVYAVAGLQPPSPDNFQAHYPRHISVVGILGVLTETGQLIHVVDRLYFHTDTIELVKKTVRAVARESGGEITVGAVRDALHSSRKIVLPLLEYLNAEGFTRRTGETHRLV